MEDVITSIKSLMSHTKWNMEIMGDFAIDFIESKELTQEFINHCLECFYSEDETLSAEDISDLLNIVGERVEVETLTKLSEEEINELEEWIGKQLMKTLGGQPQITVPPRPMCLS